MPMYDYRCRACGHEFEEIKPAGLTDLLKCPKCLVRRAARASFKPGLDGTSQKAQTL